MPTATPGPVVHDAEYYILFDQHGDAWAAEDHELDARLAELEEKFGTKPNIVHIMWADMAFGDTGIPALNKVRGCDAIHRTAIGWLPKVRCTRVATRRRPARRVGLL